LCLPEGRILEKRVLRGTIWRASEREREREEKSKRTMKGTIK
jgi:hypothetical protein